MKTQSLSTTPTVHDSINPDSVGIFRLDTAYVKAGARVLSRAFTDYPIARYLFEEAPDGPDRFRVMFEYLINSRLVRNSPVLGCQFDGELVGVAVVSDPGEGYTTPELDVQWDYASSVMGKTAMDRFEKYGDLCDETIPAGPYHYLGILGVLPKYQGLGMGRRLLKAVLEEASNHPDSLGVCLNTEATINLPFYEKHGFRIYQDVPVDSIHTWGMVWEKE